MYRYMITYKARDLRDDEEYILINSEWIRDCAIKDYNDVCEIEREIKIWNNHLSNIEIISFSRYGE